MDRLISEQEIKKWLHRWIGYLDEDMIARMEMCTKDIPSTEPKTGHWIKYGKLYQCSECKELSCCQGKFCNECGAKMVEPQERSDKE